MLADDELYRAYEAKTVLVTGGAGFIGSHLVEALVNAKAKVRVLDDLTTGTQSNLETVSDRIELLVGDICDVDTCLRAAKDTEIIFHQAALVSVPESIRAPDRAYSINIMGTSHVFDAAHACHTQRVVYASSSAVYGDTISMPLIESHCGRLMSPYAIGKRSSEFLAEYAYTMRGLTSVGLRYFNVYGPRQSPDSPYAAAIPIFVAMARAGRAPTIYGDGSQTRDFVNIHDVVRANLLAGIAQGVEAEVVNIGTGVAITITSLAELICRILAPSLCPRYDAARPGDIAHSVASTSNAEQLLDFLAKVELNSGLTRLLDA
jgi:UDP-glucose 4-epimerase